MIPMALPVLWDPELCAAEIRRVSKMGCHSITFTENPAALGLPSFHQEYWDPMWEALVDVGSILNVHLGSSGQLAVTAPDAPMDVMITLQPMNICAAAADLVWSRVFKKYTELKVALSEGGTGWIPYFLDRLDRTYEMHHAWTGQDFGEGRVPSDVFREHILTCFITDPVGLRLRDDIGVDNMCWEQDYPHSDSSWPTAPEELHEMVGRFDVPDSDVNKLTHENAMRWYRFDPFASIAKEQCTVGALRASVAGHEVSEQAMNQGRHADDPKISLGQLAGQATA
jgi:predicted TIM-barrel fold metal-dependent hydrolase